MAFFGGCSGGAKTPMSPNDLTLSPTSDNGERTFITTGTLTIDPVNMTIQNVENRRPDLVYNITGYLGNKCPGGCFRFKIVHIVGTVLEIELTVENPTQFQVYDLRVEYLDLFGKSVLNPDSYTDFLGTPLTKIKPFTAFATSSPNRAFPVGPGGMDTQALFLDFPPGSISAVNYAITASYPGMCAEPYEINGMNQSGRLTPTGGSAVISCHALDHQNNISVVYLDATPFTGVPKQMIPNAVDPTLFETTISNTQGKPVGIYKQLIMAQSTNSQHISTYNYVDIEVSEITGEPPVAVISSPCPQNTIKQNSSLYFDGRLSYGAVNPVIGYAWDFDWDNIPANFTVGSTLSYVNHVFPTIGVFKVGLRVEDSIGLFGYAMVIVNVVPIGSPSWSTGVLVSGMAGADTIERDYGATRQIVSDCDGIVHIIKKNGGKLWYITYDGASASTPLLVESTAGSLLQPTLEIDNHGDLHLVYSLNANIIYRKYEGGAWTGPAILVSPSDVPGYTLDNPTMAVNYRGEIMVVYAKVSSGNTFYWGYRLGNGSYWTPPTDLTPFYPRIDSSSYMFPNATIHAAPDGRFHMLYKSWPDEFSVWQTYFYHTTWDSGSWSTPYKFMGDSGYNIALSSMIASDGDILAVWQTNRFGNYNCMYQRWDSATQTWGSTIRVSQNTYSGSYSWVPDVAVDAEGNVMYVWEYYYSNMRHVYYKQFNETDSASVILNASENEIEPVNGNSCNQNVYLGHDGKIHLIWEDDRSNPNNYDARDVYYSVFK